MTLVLVVPALLVACSQTPRATTPAALSFVASRTASPGLSERKDGRAEAVGYVTWIGVEGGFWALRDRASQLVTDHPRIVVVLAPGSVSEKSIAAFEGDYVIVSGKVRTGASTRMSGPELVVGGIVPARHP